MKKNLIEEMLSLSLSLSVQKYFVFLPCQDNQVITPKIESYEFDESLQVALRI